MAKRSNKSAPASKPTPSGRRPTVVARGEKEVRTVCEGGRDYRIDPGDVLLRDPGGALRVVDSASFAAEFPDPTEVPDEERGR